jgi:hypothetical protein
MGLFMPGSTRFPVTSLERGRLGCGTCDAMVIVLRPGTGKLTPTCHGRPMTSLGPRWCGEVPAARGGRMVPGALYADRVTGLVVRCVSSGSGVVSCNGRELAPIEAGDRP